MARPGWEVNWQGNNHIGYTYKRVGEGESGKLTIGAEGVGATRKHFIDVLVVIDKFGDQGNLCMSMRFNGVTDPFVKEAQLWAERAIASVESFEAEMVLQALKQYEALKP